MLVGRRDVYFRDQKNLVRSSTKGLPFQLTMALLPL
jgi:hypothetical protein